MEKLKKIDDSLTKLHDDFNKQIAALGDDPREFHNALIDLSAKYPDHKELLQFIVFINDKLETNQTLFSEIIIESFNDLVKLKKELIVEIVYTKDSIPCKRSVSTIDKIKSKLSFKDIKTFGYITLGILVLVLALIDSGTLMMIFDKIMGVLK